MNTKELLIKFLKWQYDDFLKLGEGDETMVDDFLKEINYKESKCTICDENKPEICVDCADDLAQNAKSLAYCSR